MTIDEMIEALDKIRKTEENEEIQYQLSSIGIFLAKVKDLITYATLKYTIQESGGYCKNV